MIDLDRRAIAWMFRDYGSFTDVPPVVGWGEGGRGIVLATVVKHADRVTRGEKATYVTDPDAEHHFGYAFNTDGLVLWKDLLGNGPEQDNNTSGVPAIRRRRVYVGNTKGGLHVVDAESGGEVAREPLSHNPLAPSGPIILGDTLLVSSQDGRVYTRPLADMGLSVSDAIRLLMLRIADEKRLPFAVQVPNATTAKALEELDAGKGKRFDSGDALFEDLGI